MSPHPIDEIHTALPRPADVVWEVRVSTQGSPQAPLVARRAIRELLVSHWNIDEEMVERVELAISELVSNAVLYTTGEVRMEARAAPADGVVSIIVHDDGPMIPDPADAVPASRGGQSIETGPTQPDGRGLQIVQLLSDQWGVVPSATGKRVWARFERAGGPR